MRVALGKSSRIYLPSLRLFPLGTTLGPSTSTTVTRVMLAFEDNGSLKIGVRFDKQIPDGNDLGGLCEEDHGFFCFAELLRPDFSAGEEVERLAMTELIERLHCGCVVSKNSYDLLDSGGIQCVTCMKNSAAQSASGQVVPKLFPCPNNLLFFGKRDELLSSRKFAQPPSLMLDSRNDDIAIVNKSNHLFMVSDIEAGQSSNILRQKEMENGPRQIKWEQPTLNIGDMGRPLLTRSQSALESPQCTRRDDNKDPITDSTTSESFPEACVSMNLGITNNGNRMEATSTAERPMLSPTIAIAEGRDLATALSPHKGLGIS
uniref:VAL1-3 N-terminal zinc finger domain-containing protein n=1 Tax=Zea mays TaxID=4577 RepID=A0A804NS24_MAIZE